MENQNVPHIFECENIVPMIIEDIKSSLTVDKIKRENLKYEAT